MCMFVCLSVIFMSLDQMWMIRTNDRIPAGAFVCEVRGQFQRGGTLTFSSPSDEERVTIASLALRDLFSGRVPSVIPIMCWEDLRQSLQLLSRFTECDLKSTSSKPEQISSTSSSSLSSSSSSSSSSWLINEMERHLMNEIFVSHAYMHTYMYISSVDININTMCIYPSSYVLLSTSTSSSFS
jgi:hypothetical protein